VDSLRRLLPFIEPYRRRLVISIVFGLIVAALWGANLTAVFPVIQTLLDRQPIHVYVARTVANITDEITHRQENLREIDQRVAELDRQKLDPHDPKYVELLSRRVETEWKLNYANRQLLMLRRVQLHVLPHVPEDEFKAFGLILCVLMVAELIKGIFCYWQEVMIGSVVQKVIMAIRMQCLEKVLALDYQTLARDGSSGLMSRFTYDVEQVSQGVMLIGTRVVREPLKCLACFVFALWVNWRLTLLSVFFLPLLALFLNWYGHVLKRASRRVMDSMTRIYKVLEETLEGLKIVISFGAAKRHHDLFQRENDRFYLKAMRVVRIDAFAKPTMEVLGLLAMFIAMLPGAYLVLEQKTDILGIRLANDVISAPGLCMLYALLLGMLDPCRKMSATFSKMKRTAAALERIFELVDRQPLICDPEKPVDIARHSKAIEFRNVSFQYLARHEGDARAPALTNVNLTVRAGEVIALVGPNGCGKSTLVSMLPRLYDPGQGSILIDEVPIQQARLADLRRQIGLVTQETMLFDDTIAENIRYGKPDATDLEVENAARRAHVSEFAQHLPLGLQTPVGERGKELSGGQRQRVALARAIVRDPAILILDEATSAADAQSEAFIHNALESFANGRTVFIITHSMTPALLKLVDRIVVMQSGAIVASGTHEEMLNTCSVYESLCRAKSFARAA
jgi:subfamily B ATP-binding cassette protein MsbA